MSNFVFKCNVTDKHGNPLIGVEVEAIDVNLFTTSARDPIQHVAGVETTDDSGTATFTGLAPGMYYARPRITRDDIRIQVMVPSGMGGGGKMCYAAFVHPTPGIGTHTTIQAAINSLGITGGLVWICSGTYQENLTIAGKTADLWLVGAGRGEVLLQGTAASPTVTINAVGTGGVTRFRMEHMTVDHAGSQTLIYIDSVAGGIPTQFDFLDLRMVSGAMGIDMSDSNGASKFTLRDIVMESTVIQAGQLEVTDLLVDGCKFYCAGTGLYISGVSAITGARISNCRFGGGSTYALRIGAANDVQLSNCRIVATGVATKGILIGGTTEVTIDGCILDVQDGVGIDCDGIGLGIEISDCRLSCNSGQSTPRVGIAVAGYCNDIQIVDCRIAGFESYGIQLETPISGGGEHFVIDGNIVKNGGDTHSVYIGGWDYGSVTSNVLRGKAGAATTYGIYGHTTTSYTVIVGNSVRDHDDLTNLLNNVNGNVIDANYPSGAGGAPQRFFDKIVAADNSTTQAKAWADYVCDGTSDQEEINLALNSASRVRVLLMPGTYNIDGMVVVSDWGKDLIGSGDGVTIIKQINGAELAAIINVTAADCSIRDLQVDGNYANNVAAVSGIKIDNVSGTFVFHVQPHFCDVGFEETGGSGIWNNYTNCNTQNSVTTPYSLVGNSSRVVNNFLTPDGPLKLSPKVADGETFVIRNLAGTDKLNFSTAIPALDLINATHFRFFAGNWAQQVAQISGAADAGEQMLLFKASTGVKYFNWNMGQTPAWQEIINGAIVRGYSGNYSGLTYMVRADRGTGEFDPNGNYIGMRVTRNVASATNPVMKVHQDSATGVGACLNLVQDDVDEPFIDFDGQDEGAIATSTIDSDASIRVELNGVDYKIPLYAV